MDKLKIRRGDWVVVCDGRKALIFENVGDAQFPNLRMKEVKEHDLPATHEQGSDAPGRVHPSVGTARSATEQTDWHRESESAFVRVLALRLDVALTRDGPRAMIVVAPPRALGTLRSAYSPALRAAITAELPHDYVKLPVDELERRLFG